MQDAEELLDSGKRLPQVLPGQAQALETAFALAAFFLISAAIQQ